MDRISIVSAAFVLILAGVSAQSPSFINVYSCKSISVSGAQLFPELNGIYDKFLECNTRSLYRMRNSTVGKFIFFKILEGQWAIGQPTQLSSCTELTKVVSIIGQGNKLWPHMVENIWKEFDGYSFFPNPGLAVECEDIYYTVGCSRVTFPIHQSRCYNATTAIQVQAVYSIKYPPGEMEKCGLADVQCPILGECSNKDLVCKGKISEDDYEYKLVTTNCNGRHHKCHNFTVEALFQINCNIRADFACNSRPKERDGILVEYKCKRSLKYIGPDAPVESVGTSPKQTIANCANKEVDNSNLRVNENIEVNDSTLEVIVAPVAGGVFLIILITVIVIMLRNRRAMIQRENMGKSGKSGKENENIYVNLGTVVKPEIPPPAKRRDVADKKNKEHGNKPVANTVIDAVLNANPQLNSGYNVANGMYTVMILESQGDGQGTVNSRMYEPELPPRPPPNFVGHAPFNNFADERVSQYGGSVASSYRNDRPASRDGTSNSVMRLPMDENRFQRPPAKPAKQHEGARAGKFNNFPDERVSQYGGSVASSYRNGRPASRDGMSNSVMRLPMDENRFQRPPAKHEGARAGTDVKAKSQKKTKQSSDSNRAFPNNGNLPPPVETWSSGRSYNNQAYKTT